MRIGLTVLALVLDGLCLLLIAAVVVFSHPSPSGMLGVAIFTSVIGGNVPALILALRPRRAPDAGVVQANIFS